MDIDSINVISLAYLGDSVFSLFVRSELLKKGYVKVFDMQKRSIFYVSAKSQVRILNDLCERGVFSESELDLIKRGRNYKRSMHPKNTDVVTYKLSTGFEALIGYLYLTDIKRLKEIFGYIEVK